MQYSDSVDVFRSFFFLIPIWIEFIKIDWRHFNIVPWKMYSFFARILKLKCWNREQPNQACIFFFIIPTTVIKHIVQHNIVFIVSNNYFFITIQIANISHTSATETITTSRQVHDFTSFQHIRLVRRVQNNACDIIYLYLIG